MLIRMLPERWFAAHFLLGSCSMSGEQHPAPARLQLTNAVASVTLRREPQCRANLPKEVDFAEAVRTAPELGPRELCGPWGTPPDAVDTLVRDCWSDIPSLRPDFDKITQELQSVLANMKSQDRVTNL